MFTVLHRDPEDNEIIYNVNHVQWIPFTPENGDSAGVHMLCGPNDATNGVHVGRLNTGTVYVMNANGKTVATYYMRQFEKAPDQKAA